MDVAWVVVASAALAVACLIGIQARNGPLSWRRVLLGVYQGTCWVRGHQWSEREVDLQARVPFFRNPWVTVCGRCGATVVREDDEP